MLLLSVALLGGAAVTVDAQSAPAPPSITVTGQATASQPPDLATIFGSVITSADTPAEATDQNSRTLDAVIAALKALGVTDADIQTSGFSVATQYSYVQPQPGQATPPPQIVGYQAMDGISVQTKNLQGVGDLFSAMAEAGATNLSGPQYSISDPTQLRVQAIQAAARDAERQAQAAAAALGVQLGPVLSVNEGFNNAPPPPAPPPPVPAATAVPAAARPAPPPISAPSSLSATATITVVFALINPAQAAPSGQ